MQYYLHNKFINKDFQIASAKSIVIQDDILHHFVALKDRNDAIIVPIRLENVKHISKVTQRQFRHKDTLLEFIFTEESKRLRIIRLDILDSEIDEVFDKIKEQKGNDNKRIFKVCPHPKCGSLNSQVSLYCPKCGTGLKNQPDNF
jgi:hypothetical protein